MRKQLAIMATLVTSLVTMPAIGDKIGPSLIQSLTLDNGTIHVKLKDNANDYQLNCSAGPSAQTCVSFLITMWDTLLKVKLSNSLVTLHYSYLNFSRPTVLTGISL